LDHWNDQNNIFKDYLRDSIFEGNLAEEEGGGVYLSCTKTDDST
jgi:hypothetical protein